MTLPRLVLALDAVSPRLGVALARSGELIAERQVERGDNRPDLLALVAELCAEAKVAPRELGGVVALRGPGSFTGTRVACATALGLAAATGAAATGVSTLEALALAVAPAPGLLLVGVDALRGDWFVQRFRRGGDRELAAESEPQLLAPAAIDARGIDRVVAFEPARFRAAIGTSAELLEPASLAGVVALEAAGERWAWDPALLHRPLHLRAPAVTRTTAPAR